MPQIQPLFLPSKSALDVALSFCIFFGVPGTTVLENFRYIRIPETEKLSDFVQHLLG